jgi:hypothetical protein
VGALGWGNLTALSWNKRMFQWCAGQFGVLLFRYGQQKALIGKNEGFSYALT